MKAFPFNASCPNASAAVAGLSGHRIGSPAQAVSKQKKMKIFLPVLLMSMLACASPLCAQTPLSTVKTATGANDPLAHNYLSKTRKWLLSEKSLEIRFQACLATSQHLDSRQDCQRGSMLVAGQKFRLVVGTLSYYCNGEELWAYDAPNKEASLYPYDEGQQWINPVALLQDYEKHYRAKYIRQETIAGLPRNILDLTPLQPSEILKIRLYLNNHDQKPFRIEMYYSQEQVYVYDITSCGPASHVSEQDFVFDPARYPEAVINDMR